MHGITIRWLALTLAIAFLLSVLVYQVGSLF